MSSKDYITYRKYDIWGAFLAAFLFLYSATLAAQSQFVTGVPVDGRGLPASDLVYQGEVLTPEQAWQIRDFVDLSTLSIQDSEIWSSRSLDPTGGDDFSPLRDILSELSLDREQVEFDSAIQSHSGLLRFNARHPQYGGRTLTFHLDKTLHSFLLRHNFLSFLGYRLPPVKYLEQVWVEFDDEEQLEQFLARTIPQATLGSSGRWVVEREQKRVLLQDVAVTIPSEYDHYNVALGVPPEYLSSRALRSLLVVYGLLDLDESVNKFNWHVGKKRNGEILLPHFVNADFATTLADAQWILNKIKKLNRADIEKAVENSYFPKEVELLVVEKIISRRNNLTDVFEMDVPAMPVDPEVSYGQALKEGRLLQEEWDGYASRFAHGLPDSPFDGFGYSMLAELQSVGIDELVARVNSELSAYDINSARGEFLAEQFQEGLEHFVETGEFMEQSMGTWVSPVLNGQLIMSRDIIVGPFMGTDNLVQKADVFGYGARIGAHVGFDNIDSPFGGAVRGALHYVKTFSHITPVRTLKESLKEPYSNIYVPLIKRRLEQTMSSLGDIDPSDDSDDFMEQALLDFAEDIDKNLGVGESLIITERIAPELSGSFSFSDLQTRATVSGGVGGTVIKRTHLYRKDGETLQVYVDHGESANLNLAFRLDHYIPVLELRYRKTRGNYEVESYLLNIEQDLDKNPGLINNALGVAALLDSGTSELLQEYQTPFRVKNHFRDTATDISILHWRHRGLKKNGIYEVKTPEDQTNHFLRATSESQSGVNYRNFLIDLTNFFLSQYLAGIHISSDRWQNPGQTLLGVSQSRGGRFESILNGEGENPDNYEIASPFINIDYYREGWRGSRNRIIKEMLDFNEMIGRDIFNEDFIRDAAAMRLYRVELNINVYEEGIEQLRNLRNDHIQDLERRYTRRHAFERRCREIRHRNTPECGNLRFIRDKNDRCQRLDGQGSARAHGKCLLELAMKLEKVLDFDDFLAIVGDENVYVYGLLNGFRTNSEVLLEPIESHTYGRIGSRFWNGPLEFMRNISGIQYGEFSGSWLRDSL